MDMKLTITSGPIVLTALLMLLGGCSSPGDQPATQNSAALPPPSTVQQVAPSATVTSTTQTASTAATLPGTGVVVRVQPTPASQDVFGSLPQANVGDVVTVRDAQNVVCGLFIVKTAGQYGFVHVYADDVTTTTVDEGANVGDVLAFELNGQPLKLASGGSVVWQGDGQQIRADLTL